MKTYGVGFKKSNKVQAALAIAVIGGVLATGARQVSAAIGGSATWSSTPSSNLWIPATTDTNWSTGAGAAPGSTGGNTNPDIATFNSGSTQTTVNIAAGLTINSIIFDTSSVASYTIARTAGTVRLSKGGEISMTTSVTSPESITGSFGVNFNGTSNTTSVSYTFNNDSTTPSATLTFSGGTISNNSGLPAGPESSTYILSGANTGNNLISSVIANQSARPTLLDKEGTGRWILGATNTYVGATSINGGVLAITGSTAAASAVSVGALGTLEGTGTTNGSLDVAGLFSPGVDAPGIYTLGSTLKFEAGAQLAFDVGATDTTADTDLVNFATTADSLQGSGNATLALNGTIDYTKSYTIFQNVTTAGFAFASITGYDSVDFTASVSQSGNNYVLAFTPTATPEPASLGLLGMGIAGMMLRRRKA